MLGMDFIKEHCCVVNYGEDLVQLPIAVRVLVATVRVESRFVLHATLRSAFWGPSSHRHNDKLHLTGNVCLEFLDGDVQSPDDVNASEIEEPVDQPASDILDNGTELPLLSQRQYHVIYQQLRKSDVCFEERFSPLMRGHFSDGRVCVFLRSVQHVAFPCSMGSNKESMKFLLRRNGLLVIMICESQPDEGRHCRILMR